MARLLSSPEARRRLVVAAILLLAAAIRASVIFYDELSGDDATVALMAKHILSGENFPVFFYRQSYMGALNGAHLVPALFLFGPSALVVRLNAVLYSLLFPLWLYVIGRRVFDELTARLTLLLAALPPFLLTYWSTVAEPHFETNLFGVGLLLLTLAALQAPSPTRYLRVMISLGLTAGLACWTSLKALEILVPAFLVLWARNPWLPIRPAAGVLAGAFLLGSFPAWLFYLARGDPARGTAGAVTGLIEVDLTPSFQRFTELLTTVVPTLAGTYYWPADTLLRRVALTLAIVVYAAATITAAARLRSDRVPSGKAWATALLLLMLVIPFPMLYASAIVPSFDHESARYVLPVYIPVLLFVAAFLAGLWRRWRVLGMGLLAFLLGFNVWTNLSFMWVLQPAEQARRSGRIVARRATARSIEAENPQALYVDDQFSSLRWALDLTGITVSELRNEIYPPSARVADAADRVAILAERHPAAISESLTAAGIRFRQEPTPLGPLFTAFALEASHGYREVRPGGWTATATPHPELAFHAIDRDAGTRWESRSERQPGMWFQLDLGSTHRVGMVAWLPGGIDEAPTGFRLEGSVDGSRWIFLREASSYYGPLYWSGDRPVARARWGRVEARFPPREIRYLRITHLGADPVLWWTIRELFVYEGTGGLAGRFVDPTLLAGRLLRTGLRRVYADHGIGARLGTVSQGEITVLPDNIRVDPYGHSPEPDHLPRLRPRQNVALVYPRADTPDDPIQPTLRAGGWSFTIEEVNGYSLLSHFSQSTDPGRLLPAGAWTVSGSLTGPDPHALFDGNLRTRWTTQGPQRPGAWLQVALGTPIALSGLAIDLGPFRFDYPRGLALEISHDGLHWEVVETAPLFLGPLRWAGTHLLRDGVDRVIVRFGPVRVRSLRLIQTGRDPISAWSIAELRLFTP